MCYMNIFSLYILKNSSYKAQMVVDLSDPETDEDEIHMASTTGKIPAHWWVIYLYTWIE